MNTEIKAKVTTSGGTQQVTIPADFQFSTSEVYFERDPVSGVVKLSEKPLKMSMEDVFKRLDEAGARDWVFERDPLPTVERDLF